MSETVSPPRYDIGEHYEWANAIADRIAKAHRLRDVNDRDELRQAAHLALVEVAARFRPTTADVSGSFRGYACRHVKTQCIREAQRIGNGGTYCTRRTVAGRKPVRVQHYSGLAVDDMSDAVGMDGFQPTESAHDERFEMQKPAPLSEEEHTRQDMAKLVARMRKRIDRVGQPNWPK